MESGNSEPAQKHNIENADAKAQDCFSCRMIGSTSLIIASAYVFTRGFKAKLLSTKIITVVFGTSLGYTGIARFLNLYPFDLTPEISQPTQS